MINDKPTYQELEYQILQLRQQISESTAEKQNLTLQYQIAFEASNDMIAIVDTDYKYTMVNETFLKQRNCTREDIINHPVEKILGKEPFQIIKQNLDKCFKGQIIQYEIQINYPSKGLRNIEVKYLPYKNKNNMVDHVVSVMSDITERKKTEREIIAAKEKAEESEKRYKMMINAAMFPIVISSFDGKVVFINQAASDFFGVSFNEIDQLSSPDFWANSPQRTEFVSQLKENGDVNNIEIDYKTINHGVRRTIMSSTIIDYNENKAILSILYDVTEQKNAERALQKSEEKYRYIVDNAPIGIVQRSMQGSFNFCNLTVAKQFECNSIDEFLLNYDDITKRWNNPEQFIEFNKLLLKNGEVLGFENEVKLVNGKTKWFALYYKIDTTRSILDGFSLDITERK